MNFTIEGFVADCLEARREGESAIAVKDVLGGAVSNPVALEAALGDAAAMPSISIWHSGEELTILHIVWPPAVELFPHDHKMWAAIGLYGGREENTLYRRLADDRLEVRAEKMLRSGDTILLGDDTVHSVANPSTEWTAAIHVYGGDFFRDGRLMWLDPHGAPNPYDSGSVSEVLETAAAAARSA